MSMKHKTSSIVFRLLNDLKSQYRIRRDDIDNNVVEKKIETTENSNIKDVDVIYEKFIRLNILEPNLKSYISDSYRFDVPQPQLESSKPDSSESESKCFLSESESDSSKPISLESKRKPDSFFKPLIPQLESCTISNELKRELKRRLNPESLEPTSLKPDFNMQHPTITNNLGNRNEQYIERDSVNRLDEFRLKQLESETFICVHGEMGTGKKEFAFEYGWRVCADYCVRVFHFDTIESDFRQFAQLLGAQVNASATKDLVENIAFRLSELNKRKFLFIFLDVLDYKKIEIYLQEHILTLKNVKFLLTMPNENLLPNSQKSLKIKLDLFSRDEAHAYFERFYVRRPKLEENQKRKIFELGCMKKSG